MIAFSALNSADYGPCWCGVARFLIKYFLVNLLWLASCVSGTGAKLSLKVFVWFISFAKLTENDDFDDSFYNYFRARKNGCLPLWRVDLFVGLEFRLLVGISSQNERN